LVVDEAQNLPVQSLEELRMLLNFELEGRSIFQVFLLGQDELRSTVQGSKMEQVRQRITAMYHLRPLESEETKEYIVHRLTTAGWAHDPEFTKEAFEEVYRHTAGVPRIINTLCDRLLLYGYLEELHVLDLEAVRLVIKEMEQDTVRVKPPSRQELTNVETPMYPIDSEGAVPIAGSLEERVVQLENLVLALRKTVQKERALLRKAILLQLDMDEAYSEPVDEV